MNSGTNHGFPFATISHSNFVVDTGPIVAFLSREDAEHAWAVAAFGVATAPLLTCEAVITEACYLMRRGFGSSDGVLDLIARGAVRVQF